MRFSIQSYFNVIISDNHLIVNRLTKVRYPVLLRIDELFQKIVTLIVINNSIS